MKIVTALASATAAFYSLPTNLVKALPDVVWQCRAKHGTALRREATAVTARDQRL